MIKFLDFEKLKLTEKNGILRIAISNPPANVLDAKVRQEIKNALEYAKRDDAIKEIYITGEWKYFSAGADLKNEIFPIVMSGNAPKDENGHGPAYRFSTEGQALIRAIKLFPKKVTAIIDGYALGGGFELALACRTIWATPRSFVGLPEVTLGLIPGWGGTLTLCSRAKEKSAAKKYIMEGKILNASQAFADGFVNLFPPTYENLNALKKPPQGIPSPYATELLQEVFIVMDMDTESLKTEAYYFDKACSHSDAKEGISAFLEKREPKFM